MHNNKKYSFIGSGLDMIFPFNKYILVGNVVQKQKKSFNVQEKNKEDKTIVCFPDCFLFGSSEISGRQVRVRGMAGNGAEKIGFRF